MLYIDPIVDTFADLVGALSKFAFAPADANKEPLIEGYINTARKFHGLVESNLAHHGSSFAAGSRVTIADFVMASHVGNYIANPAFPLNEQVNAIMNETPLFLLYKQKVLNEFTYLKTRPTPGPL